MPNFFSLLDREDRDDAPGSVADLLRQIEALKMEVRTRDDLISIAAHELRNPMTPILGVTELALSTARDAGPGVPPRLIGLLEQLESQVHDYVRRATGLLDVTRMRSGDFQLEPADTDLSAIVRVVASRYVVVADRCEGSIGLSVDDGVRSFCDPLAAEQVIENLLSNALKFGAGRPVAIRLRVDAGMAVLEVQDHGVGMRPDQQARLFGRFEQVLSDYRAGGFGIGLWVSKRLIEAMEGSIDITSAVGRGSIFIVRLPTVRRADA